MAPGAFRPGWPLGLFAPPPSGGGPPGAAVSVATHAGVGKPFVERVPDAEARSQRLRRHTEKVSTILNSLMGTGVLVQTGASSWTIDGSAISTTGAGVTADGSTPGHYSV